jgi:hypothetical protein
MACRLGHSDCDTTLKRMHKDKDNKWKSQMHWCSSRTPLYAMKFYVGGMGKSNRYTSVRFLYLCRNLG